MAGISHLDQLLAGMKPELQEGAYVFLTFPPGVQPALPTATVARIQEPEGLTAVVPLSWANANNYPYEFVAAWILLRIHSDLAAVGLTAVVSTALAKVGISCNVIAGFYHDHLFVPEAQAQKAMVALLRVTEHQ
ncbi:MAG: ACT domain-containing protein [Bacteroidota bacterium]